MIRLLQQKPGECLKTSIACVLEVPIEQVPETERYHTVERWLKEQGYKATLMQWGTHELNSELFYVVGGYATNFPKEMHAVVYKGDKPFFDPNPATGFLSQPTVVMEIIKQEHERNL